MVNTFDRVFIELNKWLLIIFLAAMSGIVFANVVLRYTTNFSLAWAEEVARYLMVWMTFLGAGLVLRFGGHVAITNLHDFLGSRGQQALRILIALILLGFFAVMAWIGYDYMSRMGRQLTPATRVPFSYVYAAMPVGFVLLTLHFLMVIKVYIEGGELNQTDLDQKRLADGQPTTKGV